MQTFPYVTAYITRKTACWFGYIFDYFLKYHLMKGQQKIMIFLEVKYFYIVQQRFFGHFKKIEKQLLPNFVARLLQKLNYYYLLPIFL